jgi:hypothetical protein
MVYGFTFFIKFFVLFAVSILLPGVFWSWALPKEIKSTWQRSVVSIIIGFIFCLCWSFFLNTLVINKMVINLLGCLCVSILGYNLGKKKNAFSEKDLGDTLFFGFRISIILSLFFLIFNLNSQWILGGWDPGVYTNQGVSVANNNGFTPPISFSDDELTHDQLLMISKVPDEMSNSGVENYRELLPGVRIDTKTGDISNLFLRNFSNFISILIKWGSVELGFKANLFAGILFILIFSVLCYRKFGYFFAISCCSVLSLHSLFLYHIKLPTTEVLQMTLFFGFVLLNSWKTNLFTSIISGMIFFCAVANRASFIGLGSIYLFFVCLSKTVTDEKLKDRYVFLGLTILGLSSGLIYDIVLCPDTIVKLHYVFSKLLFVSIISIAASLVVTYFADMFKPFVEKLLSYLDNKKVRYGLACSLMLLTLAFILWFYFTSDYLHNQIRMLVSYFGIAATIFAFAGLFFMLFDIKNLYAKLTVVFLILVSVVTFANQYVANLYPWAARRYVTYTLPLLIMASIYFPYVLWRTKKVGLRAVSIILILIICVPQLKTTKQVFMGTEYRGIYAKLSELNKVIDSDKALIIVDDHRFATPLIYTYGHKAVDNRVITSSIVDEEGIKKYYDLLKTWQGHGNTLYFLKTTLVSVDSYVPFECSLSNVWSSSFKTSEVVHGQNQNRFEYKEIEFEPSLYEVVELPEYALKQIKFFGVDIGSEFDFLNIRSGVYEREISDGHTVRWTSDVAEFVITYGGNADLLVRISYTVKHRPVELKHISYMVNNKNITDVISSTNANDVIVDAFRVDSSCLTNTNVLSITSDTFIPNEIDGSADKRKLGIMLDSIDIDID